VLETTAASYLEKLNPEQRRAVQHGVNADGHVGAPLPVIASAGSGKTNTLAHRVAHPIVSGADPRRILLMTFSRRAASEMSKRVERIARKVLGDDDVYFPFSKTQADFQRMFAKRHMDRATPQAQALIHTLQPYPGGDDDLRAIHDLDIIDKHQMLIPAADMVGMSDYAGPNGLVHGLKVSVRDGIKVLVDS
jgi:hypothetical protein